MCKTAVCRLVNGGITHQKQQISVAEVSSAEVLRVGSTSGATIANLSNIEVFDVGGTAAKVSCVHDAISSKSGRQCRRTIVIKLSSRTPTLDKRVAAVH